jgi:NAD(P)-dependent dehydrogenase (short-subunit alcohol dehydrogenase family)
MSDDNRARVAVVTGASRGVGRGIAIALGSHGYTVYVTGRTQRSGESRWAGTIGDTAAAITAAGGKGVAARVDHRNDDEVKALFDRVRDEAGRLDLLVNNAALIREELQSELPFWQKPLAASVDLLDVGLRSGLVASYHAAPLLVETGPGLVAFTSAPGAGRAQYGAADGAPNGCSSSSTAAPSSATSARSRKRRSSPGTSSPRWRPTPMPSPSAAAPSSARKWRSSTASPTGMAGTRRRSAS